MYISSPHKFSNDSAHIQWGRVFVRECIIEEVANIEEVVEENVEEGVDGVKVY